MGVASDTSTPHIEGGGGRVSTTMHGDLHFFLTGLLSTNSMLGVIWGVGTSWGAVKLKIRILMWSTVAKF